MNYSIASNPAVSIFSLNTPAQEKCLSQFIHNSLQQTCTNQYSTDAALQVLDRAWQAQKLLWQLRTARMIG